MTCVMLKHRKCDNVGSIEDAAEEKKKSKEMKEFSQNLQNMKTSLEKLCKNRTENLKTFENDIKNMRADVETLFKQLSDHLNKLKTNIMSEISKVEKELKPEIENEHFEMKCRIPAVENDLSLFETNMKHAPPAQFIQAMEKLEKQKEILDRFLGDQSQNLREIRITFKANEKLLELSRGIQECGEVKVSRIENNQLQHFETSKVNMLTAVPSLTSEVNTGFHVRGIAL
ncbi:hypothetical protein FSP39_011206 [Pinctada imbricata]|uniref:Uncharacterized protein n=1 Tax=Pinctada imbricata TaxID=66713 RepID=A0AA89C4F7_PINIB|nr:hypothetical protein FSP39_011206 [Pinctada imbricata]